MTSRASVVSTSLLSLYSPFHLARSVSLPCLSSLHMRPLCFCRRDIRADNKRAEYGKWKYLQTRSTIQVGVLNLLVMSPVYIRRACSVCRQLKSSKCVYYMPFVKPIHSLLHYWFTNDEGRITLYPVMLFSTGIIQYAL